MPKRRAGSLAATVAAAAAAVAAASGGDDGVGGPAALPFGRRARHGRRRLQSAAPSSAGPEPTAAPTTEPPTFSMAPTLPKCSCGPREYEFEINLDGKCADETISGQPGIDGSLCFYAQGEQPESADDIDFPGGRRGLRSAADAGDDNASDAMEEKWARLLDRVDHAPHREHAAAVHRQRQAQNFDTTPTVITSVTFLEADTTPQLNIINQNSEYFNTTLTDGDVITFESISSQLNESLSLYDQIDLFPGGVMLVLYGTNADGVVVQNVNAWGYTADECGAAPLSGQESIGWLALVDSLQPRAAFCPAVTDMPTAFPSGSPTTAPPTANPTEGFDKSELTTKPTRTPTPPPTRVAKSSKAKGCKSGRKGKSSKGCRDASMSMMPSGYTLFPKHSKKGPGDVNGYALFPKSGKGEGYTLFGKSGKKAHVDESIIDTGYAIFPKSGKTAGGKSEKEGLFPKSDKAHDDDSSSKSNKGEGMSYGPSKSSKRAKGKGWKSKGAKANSVEYEVESAKSSKALFGKAAEGAYALFKHKSAKNEGSSKSAKASALFEDSKSSKSTNGASGKAGKLFKPSGKATKVFKPKSGKGEEHYGNDWYGSEDDGPKPPPGSVQVARPPVGYTEPSPTLPPVSMSMPGTPSPSSGSSELSKSELDGSAAPTPTPTNGTDATGTVSPLPSPGVAVTPTYPPTPAATAPPTLSPTVPPTTAPPSTPPTVSPVAPPTVSPVMPAPPTLAPVVPRPAITAAPVVPRPPITAAPAATPREDSAAEAPPTDSPRPSTHYPTYSPSTHYPTYSPVAEGAEEPV